MLHSSSLSRPTHPQEGALSNLSQHPQQLKGYVEGPLESSKHAALRGDYYAGLQAIKGLGYEVEEE